MEGSVLHCFELSSVVVFGACRCLLQTCLWTLPDTKSCKQQEWTRSFEEEICGFASLRPANGSRLTSKHECRKDAQTSVMIWSCRSGWRPINLTCLLVGRCNQQDRTALSSVNGESPTLHLENRRPFSPGRRLQLNVCREDAVSRDESPKERPGARTPVGGSISVGG